MLMLLPCMILCSLLFITLKHPLSCGMILLIQTILTAMITGMMNYNYWYSYILFLIMIGGMLILFIYMTSIASNEKFKFSSKLSIMTMLTLFMTLLIMIIDNFYMNLITQNSDLMNQMMMMNYNLSMMKYFNNPNFMIMLIMIIYLFITLIAIVKITNFTYGPLRQKF